jgi:Zn-finger nucleic acid-binding protein
MALMLTRPCWQCAHCSTMVCPEPAPDGIRVLPQSSDHSCPVCRHALTRAAMDDREPIEICQTCKGIFMARRAFATTLLARRRAATDPATPPLPADRRELERRVACPSCGGAMVTDWYYGPGNIVIDTCPACDAVWLDAGELKRAVNAPGRDRRR